MTVEADGVREREVEVRSEPAVVLSSLGHRADVLLMDCVVVLCQSGSVCGDHVWAGVLASVYIACQTVLGPNMFMPAGFRAFSMCTEQD